MLLSLAKISFQFLFFIEFLSNLSVIALSCDYHRRQISFSFININTVKRQSSPFINPVCIKNNLPLHGNIIKIGKEDVINDAKNLVKNENIKDTLSFSKADPEDDDKNSSCSNLSDRRTFFKKSFLSFLGINFLLSSQKDPKNGGLRSVNAFCGKPYDSWVYYTPHNEGLIPFEYSFDSNDQNTNKNEETYEGEIFIQQIGSAKEEKKMKLNPVLIISGGPGLSHDYLETLEMLAITGRRVIVFDMIGSGESTKTNFPFKYLQSMNNQIDFVTAQVQTVIRFLELEKYHLYGHGFGAMVAMKIASSSDLRDNVNDIKQSITTTTTTTDEEKKNKIEKEINNKEKKILSLSLASPFLIYNSPSALAKLVPQNYQKSLPVCVETSMKSSLDTTATMNIDKPYVAKDMLSIMALDQIKVPSLLVYGEKEDMVDKELINSLKKKLQNSESSLLTVSDGGALSHLGPNRNDYMEKINAFLTNIDTTIDKIK